MRYLEAYMRQDPFAELSLLRMAVYSIWSLVYLLGFLAWLREFYFILSQLCY